MRPRMILARFVLHCLACLAACLLQPAAARTEPPPPLASQPVRSVTLDEAIRYALENNPQLAAARQQRGIAAAAVIIARTYPFNPVTQSTVLGVTGPEAAGITNAVPNQHQVTIQVEVRGQRTYRKQAALAALTRTDWEILSREVNLSVELVRAFDSLVYRREKLRVTEDFVLLNRQGLEQVRKLVESGALRPADLIVARAEVDDIQSQVGLGRTALAVARRDFYRALGLYGGQLEPEGSLDRPPPSLPPEQLTEEAFDRRPDLRARQAAIAEAEAQLRLTVADRYGNPNVGPVYQYNETRVNFIGLQFGVPIPLFNRKQGEIRQRQAQRDLAWTELRQTEVEIRQDVRAALDRLAEAGAWVESYRKQILPDLQRSLREVEQLFQQGQPGVDQLRVLDVRRKLLRARDGYLDALREYTQALADLSAAVGDPTLALGAREITAPPAHP